MKKYPLFLILFLIAMVVATGCTRSEPAAVSPPVTVVQTPLATPIPTTSEITPVPTPLVTYQPPVPPESVMVSATPTRVATDNPYLEYLNVRKKTFDYSIPNCPMGVAFPAIVNDSRYGIQHQVPKLTALSEDEYETFLWKYTEGKAENTPVKTLNQCQGADGDPRWNFVETRVILNPTNVRPANYTLSVNVRSKGEVIARFMTTQTLTIDKKILLTYYIPLKADDQDLFETVGVTYTRLPN